MGEEIRELSIDDYDEIIRVWSIAGLPYKPQGRDKRDMIEKEMQLETVKYFGMFADDILIGVSIANFDGRRGWVNRLAVDPDYRGKGYAVRLIEKCHEFLSDAGALVMTALIEDINYPSISTFQKAGYKCEKEILYFAKRPSDEA